MGKQFAKKLMALVLLAAQIFALLPGVALPAYAEQEEIAVVQEETLPTEAAEEEAPAETEEQPAPAEPEAQTEPAEPEVPAEPAVSEVQARSADAAVAATVSEDTPVPYAYSNAALQTEDIEMSGITYSNAIVFTMGYTGLSNGYTGEVTYNFRGQYKSLSFKAGYYDGDERNATMTVIADGVTVYDAVELSYENIAKSYTVSLSGVDQLVIRFHSDAYDKTKYAIGAINAVRSSTFQEEETKISDEFFNIPQYQLTYASVIDGPFTMGGYDYEDGYLLSMGYGWTVGYTAKVCFNFNEQYEKLNFDIARYMNRANESYTRSAYLTIEVDGTVLSGYDKKEMKWNDLVLPVEVDLSGVSQVVISVNSDGYDTVKWAIGDIQLVSDGKAHGVLLAASKATVSASSPTYDLNPRVYPSDAVNKNYTMSTDYAINAVVTDDGIVYGRSKGIAVITATTEDGGHAAHCTITSNFPAAKYIPSINGWGFENIVLSDDDYLNNFDYYVGTYKRICGRSLSYAIDDAASSLYDHMNGFKPGYVAVKPAAALMNGIDFVWYAMTSAVTNGGLCHGMSISSAITYTGDIPFSTWDFGSAYSFNNPYAVKSNAEYFGYSSTLDLYLRQMIYGFQLSQFTATQFAGSWVASAAAALSDYDTLFEKVENFRSTGKDPITLELKKSGEGHTVLPYDVLYMEDRNEIRLYIYDSNLSVHENPDDVYVTFMTDDSGDVTGWYFNTGSHYYYEGDTILGYNGGLSDYAKRLKDKAVVDLVTSYLFSTSEDFSVKSGDDTLVRYNDRVFTGERTQDIAVPMLLTGASSTADTLGGAAVALLEDADFTFDISGAGADTTTIYYTENSACVITCGSDAVIDVHPGESTDRITVTPSQDGNVTIRYNNDDKSVIVSGETSGTVTVKTNDEENEVSFKGYSSIQATTIINGEETTGEKTTVSPTGTYNVTDDAQVERDPTAFDDVVDGAYYSEPVAWAVKNGITNGLSATRFGVDENCTRAQFVTFLWRAAGCPEPTSTTNKFTDVAEGQFYSKAVLWAVEEGITNGLSATKFGVNEPCSRSQVVTFLHRFTGSPDPTITEHTFADVLDGQFYSTAILWAVENGITTGLNATTFGVNIPCNRAQVVTFLYRALAE